ncbi:MAG: hypothetical protein AB7G24_03495 [Novosphingobium sp.]|jgi:hypothetical protein
MSVHFRKVEAAGGAQQVVGKSAIEQLRRSVWSDAPITRVEADTLFLANDQLRGGDPEWGVFFTDALVEYLVDAGTRAGHIDESRARWLKARILFNGRIAERDELEVLLRALERAQSVPGWLRNLALEEVEQAVIKGSGCTRPDNNTPAGSINAGEVKSLRRILFAHGGPAISRADVEVLFRIKAATLHGDNDPSWETLFVDSTAAYLLGFGGIYNLSDERSDELEDFLTHTGAAIGDFLNRAMRMAIAEGDLYGLLEADETLDPLEKTLIAFLASRH